MTSIPSPTKPGSPVWQLAELYPDQGDWSENDPRRRKTHWDGADLVIEVVSEDDPDRDWVTKREEYAAAGIPEYWIVDPRGRSVTVLSLPSGADRYVEFSRHIDCGTAQSQLLSGIAIELAELFGCCL